MITITNTQETFTIDEQEMTAQLDAMRRALDYDGFAIGVLVCDEKTIQLYNKQYRQKDSPTDILSFPYHTELKPGEQITPNDDDDKNLGDIILCPAVIDRKRVEWDNDFPAQLTMLLAHGIAHLLNYRHETDEEFATMQVVEKKLLAELKK